MVVMSLVTVAFAQGAPNDYLIGYPPHADFSGSDFENVQLNNGNLHIEIPLSSTAGRGLSVTYKLVYDSKGWGFNEHCGRISGTCADWVVPNPGAHGLQGCCSSGNHLAMTLVASTSYSSTHTTQAISCSGVQFIGHSYNMSAPDGTKHHFVPDPLWSSTVGTCTTYFPVGTTLYADDGSGWMAHTDPSAGQIVNLVSKDGTIVGGASAAVEDTNGNEITSTDTLGRPLTNGFTYYDSNGVLQTIQVVYQNVAIYTNMCRFQQGDYCLGEYSSTWSLPQIITLPNGMTYTFTYDQGSSTHPYYGQPLSVTLPTGGTITWVWNGENDTGPVLLTRRLSSDPGPWTYSFGLVTDPANNDTTYSGTYYAPQYSNSGTGAFYITNKKYYQGSHTSGTLIKTVQTDYNVPASVPVLPIRDTTTWNQQNLVSSIETDYDSFPWLSGMFAVMSASNPIEKREYGYASGSRGALVRTTDYGYLHLTNSTYRGLNILDKVTSQKTYAGSSQVGTLVAQTLNTYDGVAIPANGNTSANPAPNHDYTNFPASYNYRGNLTQISRGLKSGSTWNWLNTNKTYNDLGEVLTSTDPLNKQTSYDYTDAWATISNPQCVTSAHSYGFPTTITDPLGHRTKHTYYSCTSFLGSTQNENDIAASRPGTTYSYDLIDRLISTNFPDTGQTTLSYNDAVPYMQTTSQLIQSGMSKVSTTVHDGLGRVQQTQLVDPDCTTGSGLVKVDYAYGYTSGTGAFRQVSTPYCDTPNSTYGLMTTTQKDALDRVVSITQTDGSTVTTTYSGTTTGLTATVTDEAGKARKSQTDALGRMTFVWEDPASANYETDYTYDVLDNLTGVTQKGGALSASWRTRSFTYDSLSRLTCAENPEITPGLSTVNPASCPASYNGTYTNGTIGYAYDADSNLITRTAPAPNQTSTSVTVSTNYSYDADNRLTQKSYTGSPSTPTVKYGYDGVALTGCTTAPPSVTDSNPIDARTSMCDGSGATSWTHDPMDRVLSDKRTINGTSAITNTTAYTYYLDGEPKTLTNPGGNGTIVTYTPNSAGRFVSAADSVNTYVSNAKYAPHGALASLSHGGVIFGALTYNSRLQPLQLAYGTSQPNVSGNTCPQTAASIMHRVYDFHLGNQNNGNVQVINNCRDTNRTQNFFYDNFNRITQAYTTGNSPLATSWGEIFTTDAWGNLTNKSPVTNKTNTEPLNVAPATIKNQVNGVCNDAAGNLVQNSSCPITSPTYSYDIENQLTSAAAGYTYVYDGDGKRVKKCSNSGCTNGTLYWTGVGSDPLVESGLGGSNTEEYIFFNGKRVARAEEPVSTTDVHYYFSDHLGSADVITNYQGNVTKESDYYPYGGEIVVSGSDINNYKFTGKERDPESGLDDFDARFYSSPFGRFMQPDWAAKPTDVPYANFGNPQSLNLYSYVQNNPTTMGDPDGHCCDFNDVMNFTTALGNAWGSDNLLGAGRQEQTTTAGKIGAAFGDTGATIQGAGEALFGGGEALVTSPAAATGVGALVPAVGVGIAIHGSATATFGFTNLFKSASDSSSTSTESKPHGNTAGDQPAELYEKYDKSGNFEKHGVSQDASQRYSKKEVNGGEVRVVDRGTRREMLSKERQRVETNPGPKNKEPWAGKKSKKTKNQ